MFQKWGSKTMGRVDEEQNALLHKFWQDEKSDIHRRWELGHTGLGIVKESLSISGFREAEKFRSVDENSDSSHSDCDDPINDEYSSNYLTLIER